MDVQKNILVAGAGKIGCTLAAILSSFKHTHVTLIDIQTDHIPKALSENIDIVNCDIKNTAALTDLIKKQKIQGIVSTLPYYCNKLVAVAALANNCHYFDLTEDVKSTQNIFALAEGASSAFVPQCGVAPGFINMIANNFIQQQMKASKSVNTVKMYCGALPIKHDNPLGYALTWSTDGLINEYDRPCRILENGALKIVPPLTACETVHVNSEVFEAFNTSGGVGTLVDTYQNKIQNIFYKTLRYPGHCEKMKFMMQDLKLNEDRDTLKKILENVLPKGGDDIVITHVEVDDLIDTRYFYPKKIANIDCSAIQTVTSTSASIVIDTVMSHPGEYRGPIKQEDFQLADILSNPHAQYLSKGV